MARVEICGKVKMMAEEAKERRPALYVGRRLEKTKLVHMFRGIGEDEGGFYYPKVRGTSRFSGAEIGCAYDMADGVPIFWQPRRLPEHDASEEQALAWQGLDADARLRKNELQMSPTPDLDAALEKIRAARSQISPFKRTPFDIWVLSQIQKAGA